MVVPPALLASPGIDLRRHDQGEGNDQQGRRRHYRQPEEERPVRHPSGV